MFSALKLKPASVGSRLFCVGSLQTKINKIIWHQLKSPSHQTLHHLLDQCSSMRQLKLVHAQIILHGLACHTGQASLSLRSSGRSPLCTPPVRSNSPTNKFMCNHLIRGYSNIDDPMKSLFLYRQMVRAGLTPNQFTFPFVLKACAAKPFYWEAVIVHAQAIKLGMGPHACVQNAIFTVYSKMGFCDEAALLFQEMLQLGVEADVFTLVSLLSASSKNGDLDLGRFVHLYVVITGVEFDSIVTNALIDMYAKCRHLQFAKHVFDQMLNKDVVSWTCMVNAYANHGLVENAVQIFNQMPVKNVVSWNSIICCHVQKEQYTEVVEVFHRMCISGVMPDDVSILSCCSNMGDLALGKQAHIYVCDNNITVSVTLCNSLIDMYAKFGALQTAIDILWMPEKNVVSWNVIIGPLALHGFGEEAIEMFKRMQARGLYPDEITLTGLLSALSHSGLVDMGRYYFDIMSSTFGISPGVEHYSCMVDLLGRGGS